MRSEKEMNNILSESLTPVEEICEKERLELIHSILNTMDPIDKKVIVERVLKGYTWDKIASKFPRRIPKMIFDKDCKKLKRYKIGVTRENVRRAYKIAIVKFMSKSIKYGLVVDGARKMCSAAFKKYYADRFGWVTPNQVYTTLRSNLE